jgi:hypothetical protein
MLHVITAIIGENGIKHGAALEKSGVHWASAYDSPSRLLEVVAVGMPHDTVACHCHANGMPRAVLARHFSMVAFHG